MTNLANKFIAFMLSVDIRYLCLQSSDGGIDHERE